MASANAELVFQLEITSEETEALMALLYAVNWDDGVGPAFGAIFQALTDAGAETGVLTHRFVQGGGVIIEQPEAA